ncbi:MAG TPA: hypothetical protein VLY24_02315 [Bryobacteraceae bacterium]|nr:hypothetical protein [Bryobacteraceae bacterium]
MKHKAFCLALLGLPICGAERPSPQAPVALYVRFEHQIPDTASETLQRELRAILATVGFDFAWRSADEPTNEVWADLAVITFKGHCAAGDLIRTGRFQGRALGWTHVSDGRILPFAEVDCDRIGAFLGPELFARGAKSREKVFERAVARVAAHELYHVFTQSAEHGSWGVAKAEFTTEELLSDGFHFQRGEAQVLRHKGAQDWLQFSLLGR